MPTVGHIKTTMTTLLGNVIDEKYELLAQIGSGGMGTVYRAKQHPFEREVALKMLAGNLPEDAESLVRFEREALAISKLKHKNIVMFYGYGAYRGAPYMVMEYIHGHSLQYALRSNEPLDPQYAMRVIEQIAEGLSCAHANGLVHRDLKPNNVMIVEDDTGLTVKIIDFGLARLLPSFGAEVQKLTEAGSAVGSVLYMSPEQCTGLTTDARSDIYALGCIMHHCLTGAPPFDGDHSVVVMQHHISHPLPRINTMVPGISDKLQAIVDRATAKDSDSRYQSADEMLRDVRAYLGGGEIAPETKAAIAQAITGEHDASPVGAASKAIKIRRLSIAAAIAAISVAGFFFGEQIEQKHADHQRIDNLWTMTREADSEFSRQNFAEAADLYARIVQVYSGRRVLNFDEYDNAVQRLAECYLRLNRMAAARQLIEEQLLSKQKRLLSTQTGSVLVLEYLYTTDTPLDYGRGSKFLERVIAVMRRENRPGWGGFVRQMIIRLTVLKQNDKAIALAKEAAAALSDPAEKVIVLVAEGDALRKAGRMPECKRVLSDAIELARDSDITNSSVLHHVGAAYEMLGRFEEARQVLEEASMYSGTATSVRPSLAECYAVLGDMGAAQQALLQTLDDARKQDPLTRTHTEGSVRIAIQNITNALAAAGRKIDPVWLARIEQAQPTMQKTDGTRLEHRQ